MFFFREQIVFAWYQSLNPPTFSWHRTLHHVTTAKESMKVELDVFVQMGAEVLEDGICEVETPGIKKWVSHCKAFSLT